MNKNTRKRLGAVARIARPLSPLEQLAAKRWFGSTAMAHLAKFRIGRGGAAFCVVNGDYSRATTPDLMARYNVLHRRGLSSSPPARALRHEILRRQQNAARVGDTNGPTAA